MYFVYVLLCGDSTLYTGITNDLEGRLEKHKAGTGARYTRARGAERFVYTERKRTKGSALRREAAIKKMSRAAKLALAGLEAK